MCGKKIVHDWLQGKGGPTEIGKELKLDKQTVLVLFTSSFAKDVSRQEREEIKYAPRELLMLSTTQSTASKYKEIQRKIVENNVCLTQNVLSRSASYKNSFGPMIPDIKI